MSGCQEWVRRKYGPLLDEKQQVVIFVVKVLEERLVLESDCCIFVVEDSKFLRNDFFLKAIAAINAGASSKCMYSFE